MKNTILALLVTMAPILTAFATEYHVAVTGNDKNPGTQEAPLRSIQHAANLALSGDIITVHTGIYRERINPPRGGESDSKRIVYQAAPGEKVEIKGSEIVKGWQKVEGDVWKVVLPNSFFGSFNPYSDQIHGDWFDGKKRQHHTGAVYLNGDWMAEAAGIQEVLQTADITPLWFALVNTDYTTIWAQFKEIDPNKQLVEINVRRTVFYPEKTGMNYITVRGFAMRQAATPWAPPTSEQVALIGTNWSRGWIIENNDISHSVCSGIALGKYGDEWDNQSANSAEGYVGTIDRALKNGWSRENIGHHIVRNNTISNCEQTGIVGSLGAAFSTVTDNTIHDIHVRRLFSGAEMAGIKFHAAIDVTISRNHIYRTCLGLWLDWMAQGTHVTGNLFHDNGGDMFLEVDHGPYLVDNNIFLSPVTVSTRSQGGAYVHNLFAGIIKTNDFDGRKTPFHKAHSTEVAGLHDNPRGDERYYNNLFVGRADLSCYDDAKLPVSMDGNVFMKDAKPSRFETNPMLRAESDPECRLVQKANGTYLEATLDKGWAGEGTRKLVTTVLLGKASIPDLPFEQADGTPLKIDTDYFGKPRNPANPAPGPFESPGTGKIELRVWGGSIQTSAMTKIKK